MQAHNIIVICSGYSRANSGDELNRLFETARQLKKKPILVLGPDGDELLRSCDFIEDCEIVFDPNFEGGFFSGLKAGLFATHGPAFVASLEMPIPSLRVWHALEKSLFHLQKNARERILRPVINGEVQKALPILITTQGIAELMKLPALSPWPLPEQESLFLDVHVMDDKPLNSTYP